MIVFFTKITISILFQKYPKIFKKFNNALKLSIKVNKKTKKKDSTTVSIYRWKPLVCSFENNPKFSRVSLTLNLL